ncbi:hypothetical protein [Pseudoclavibacter sp. AY1H1]|uniref:hypothetical protein n=1 Tax=Pseudoclavibacter sp. AY1H1 TaxID=2080584 RepID=UPI000CE7FB08|nr:hypothetical protein [Pseudoclavibacter sp. AY1H1]PPF36979.1 hypothetical protein C5E05_08440 [Pseudoclavibacter sp. AY1H1]
MTYSNSSDVNESGFTARVTASTEAPSADRHGDHATYTIALDADSSVLTPGAPGFTWSFAGEIERTLVVKSLRELAARLEEL